MTQSSAILGVALILIAVTGGLLWHLESHRRQVARRLAMLAPDAAIQPETMTIRRTVQRKHGLSELADKLVGRNAPLAAPLSIKTGHAVALAVIAFGIVFMTAHSFLEAPAWIAALAGAGAFLFVPRMVCAMALSNQRNG